LPKQLRGYLWLEGADPFNVICEATSFLKVRDQIGWVACPVDEPPALHDVFVSQILQDLCLIRKAPEKWTAVPLGIEDFDRKIRLDSGSGGIDLSGQVGESCPTDGERFDNLVVSIE